MQMSSGPELCPKREYKLHLDDDEEENRGPLNESGRGRTRRKPVALGEALTKLSESFQSGLLMMQTLLLLLLLLPPNEPKILPR